MSDAAPTPAPPAEPGSRTSAPPPDRRADVDGKQTMVADLLREWECEGLLVLDPENFAWLTSGATARNVLDPAQLPGLFYTAESRALLANNVDAQRLFDEEIDDLGFQLKEWPWYWERESLVGYLGRGRPLACDVPLGDCKMIGERLRWERRGLTLYELAAYRELGLVVAHALEATCRTLGVGQSEQEIAGQLAHRVLHRGAETVAVMALADGRARRCRRGVPSSATVARSCLLSLTARQAGLHATASRSMSIGPPDPMTLKEHDTACKVTAHYFASSWPDGVPEQLLQAGRRVMQISGFEHEWRLAPQGWLTGRAPVEQLLTPKTTELFRMGLAVTWQSSIGAALSCDSFVVTAKGPMLITQPATSWPVKRIRVQGAYLNRPDILQRDK
jgi:Xaa-Pro aminopeptidase